MNNRIYISGPITGNKHYKRQFARKAKELKKRGYEVLNPCFIKATLTWEEYMFIDLNMLKLCSHIYMMKGWTHSMGATMEHEQAKKDGLQIIYEEI